MVLQHQPLLGQQLPEQLAAHMAQIAGIDGVQIPRLAAGVGKLAQQGGRCSRCHGGPHVVDVPDAVVLHPAEGRGADAHPLPGGA